MERQSIVERVCPGHTRRQIQPWPRPGCQPDEVRDRLGRNGEFQATRETSHAGGEIGIDPISLPEGPQGEPCAGTQRQTKAEPAQQPTSHE